MKNNKVHDINNRPCYLSCSFAKTIPIYLSNSIEAVTPTELTEIERSSLSLELSNLCKTQSKFTWDGTHFKKNNIETGEYRGVNSTEDVPCITLDEKFLTQTKISLVSFDISF